MLRHVCPRYTLKLRKKTPAWTGFKIRLLPDEIRQVGVSSIPTGTESKICKAAWNTTFLFINLLFFSLTSTRGDVVESNRSEWRRWARTNEEGEAFKTWWMGSTFYDRTFQCTRPLTRSPAWRPYDSHRATFATWRTFWRKQAPLSVGLHHRTSSCDHRVVSPIEVEAATLVFFRPWSQGTNHRQAPRQPSLEIRTR